MRIKIISAVTCLIILAAIIIISCASDTSSSPVISYNVPAVYQKIYGATDLYIEDNTWVVIKSIGRPDHRSPYYQGTQWDSLYEAFNDTSFHINPNRIATSNLTFRIPLNPALNNNHPSTPMGPMGVVLNGVAVFNQYAAGGAPLTGEISSFDQYGGHPQQQGQYHYHIKPSYLTAHSSDSALIGFLLDGFPVYGPMEDGRILTDSDLDVYHGHFSVKEDYPNGIYHYHTTSEAPYINGDGFYGTAGTVSY